MPPRKRKAKEEEEQEEDPHQHHHRSDAGTQPPQQQQQGMNAYEMQRQQLIARNRARLLALGIEDAVRGLSALAPPPPPRKRPTAAAAAPKNKSNTAEPARRSQRVRGIKAEPAGDEAEEAERSLSKRHRRRGNDDDDEEDDDDEAAAAAKRARLASCAMTEKERLTQLALGGLVDVTDAEAVFIVVGSRGNHYTVRFKDATVGAGQKKKQKEGGGDEDGEGGGDEDGEGDGNNAPPKKAAAAKMVATCECMDHRCRKRDCKHILLCAREVGLLDEGGGAAGRAGVVRHGDDWGAAVRGSIERLGAADEADVREVRRKDEARRRRQRQGVKAEKGEEGEEEEEEGDAEAAALPPPPTAAAAAASAAAAEDRLKTRPDLKPALAFM